MSAPICRICRCESDDASSASSLISPCLCTGSAAYIHPLCLHHWIEQRPSLSLNSTAIDQVTLSPPNPFPASSLTCELCHGQYAITWTERSSPLTCGRHLLPPILDIFSHVVFVVIATFAIISLPEDLPPSLKPLTLTSLAVLAVLSFVFMARRWPKWPSTLTLVGLETPDTTATAATAPLTELLMETGGSEKANTQQQYNDSGSEAARPRYAECEKEWGHEDAALQKSGKQEKWSPVGME